MLPPGAVTVRCVIFGPSLNGKWERARLDITFKRLTLSIQFKDGTVVLSWVDDPGNCWKLQQNAGNGWIPSAKTTPPKETISLFRLIRKEMAEGDGVEP